MKEEGIGLKGFIRFVLKDRLGKVKETREMSNLIVNAGKEYTAKLLNGVSTDFFDYIAIGTGTTAADAADTVLETETHRELATLSYEADYKAKFVATFNFSGSYAITESGVLDAAAVGNLLCRQVFSAINVTNGDSLEITWKITVS